MTLKIPVRVLARGVETTDRIREKPLYDIMASVEMLDGTVQPVDCAIWLSVKTWDYEYGHKRPEDYTIRMVLIGNTMFKGGSISAVEKYVDNWIAREEDAWFELRYENLDQ